MRRRKGSVLLAVLLALSALSILIIASVSPIFLLRKRMKMVEEGHDKEFANTFVKTTHTAATDDTIGELKSPRPTLP